MTFEEAKIYLEQAHGYKVKGKQKEEEVIAFAEEKLADSCKGCGHSTCQETEHCTKMNENNIKMYYHCQLCMDECPDGTSMASFAQFEFGATEKGFQLWCRRHDCNVLHIDLGGRKVLADTTRNEQ